MLACARSGQALTLQLVNGSYIVRTAGGYVGKLSSTTPFPAGFTVK